MNAVKRSYRTSLGPFHAFLLAGTVPLFLGALLGDVAYAVTYELQWKNFASWLIVGALVFCGLATAAALFVLFDGNRRGPLAVLSFLLLAVAWLLGLINAFVHAMDAWASMPESLILSSIVAVLVSIATVLGFSTLRKGVAR